MSRNIRVRAALCLALSLANASQSRAEEPVCAKHAGTVESWRGATREVQAAEAEIEAIEENPVLASLEQCSHDAIVARRCNETWYQREEELERARDRLASAEEKLAAVEESARIAEVPMLCLVETGD